MPHELLSSLQYLRTSRYMPTSNTYIPRSISKKLCPPSRLIFAYVLSRLPVKAFSLTTRLVVDLTSLYPTAVKPQFMLDIRAWYVENYADRFFSAPPAWFGMYMWMEALYHVPLSIWAVGGLIRGKSFLNPFVSLRGKRGLLARHKLEWKGYGGEVFRRWVE